MSNRLVLAEERKVGLFKTKKITKITAECLLSDGDPIRSGQQLVFK